MATRAFSWFLALRYLLSRWVNVLGMGGVALAVWALIVVVAVFSGFISGIEDNTKSGSPDLLVTSLAPETSFESLEATIRADEDVVAIAPRLRHHALYFPIGRGLRKIAATDPLPISGLGFEFVELLGIDTEAELETSDLSLWLDAIPNDDYGSRVEATENPLSISIERVRAARAQARPFDRTELLRVPPGVLVSRDRARSSRIDTGQELEIVSAHLDRSDPESPEMRKIRRVFVLTGKFESGHRVVDHTMAIVDIEQVRTLLGHDASDPGSIDIVSDVAIRVRPGADLKTVARRLEKALGNDVANVLTWREQNKTFLDVVHQERRMMKLILFAVGLVAAFLIYATMHMMVTQKVKDIGILSAMGASRDGTKHVFLICGVTVGVLGCVLGATIGCLTSIYLDEINRYFIRGTLTDIVNVFRGMFGLPDTVLSIFPPQLYALDRIPTVVDPTWVSQVTIGAFAVTIFAAWLPARRAARFEPVRALGYE